MYEYGGGTKFHNGQYIIILKSIIYNEKCELFGIFLRIEWKFPLHFKAES